MRHWHSSVPQPHVAAIAPAILDLDNDQQLDAGRHSLRPRGCQAVGGPRQAPRRAARPNCRGLTAHCCRPRSSVGTCSCVWEDCVTHLERIISTPIWPHGCEPLTRSACTNPIAKSPAPIAESPRGFQAARHAELLYWCHARPAASPRRHCPAMGCTSRAICCGRSRVRRR